MDFLDLRDPVSACSHGLGLMLAVPGTLILWKGSGGNRSKQLSLLVFGLSLGVCYAASTMFHAVRVSGDRLLVFNILDHIGIITLIAGTYTPIVWNLLSGRWRWTSLMLVWLTATAGALVHLACGVLPAWVSTLLYLGMGWVAIILYGEIAKRMSHRPLQPILLGGVLYSIGAVVNLLEWPVLWPGVFQAHELFHLFVMGGSFSHFWFMFKVVLPSTSPSPTSASSLPGSPALAPIPIASVRRRALAPRFRA